MKFACPTRHSLSLRCRWRVCADLSIPVGTEYVQFAQSSLPPRKIKTILAIADLDRANEINESSQTSI